MLHSAVLPCHERSGPAGLVQEPASHQLELVPGPGLVVDDEVVEGVDAPLPRHRGGRGPELTADHGRAGAPARRRAGAPWIQLTAREPAAGAPVAKSMLLSVICRLPATVPVPVRVPGQNGEESRLRSAVSGSTPGGTYCVHAQCSHRFSTPGRTVQQAGVR